MRCQRTLTDAQKLFKKMHDQNIWPVVAASRTAGIRIDIHFHPFFSIEIDKNRVRYKQRSWSCSLESFVFVIVGG